MAKEKQPKQRGRGMLSNPRAYEGAPRDRGPNARVKLGNEMFGRRKLGISKDERALINQREAADLALGDMGQHMLPGVQSAYEQPFDTSRLPQSPWDAAGDVKGLYDKYYQDTYSDFERTAEPEFQKQIADFDTAMVQRGIPVGSELYNKQRKELLDTQEGQRQTMRTQAMQGAGSQANLWNTMQSQNFQGAYDYYNNERNRPLSEYNALIGSQSGIGDKALDQIYARQNAQWQMAHTPHGGGGGGGGGSGGYSDKYGFATPQEYDQYRMNLGLQQKEAEYALAAKYGPKAPSQPSGWATGLGGILGGIATGIGGALGKGIF